MDIGVVLTIDCWVEKFLPIIASKTSEYGVGSQEGTKVTALIR